MLFPINLLRWKLSDDSRTLCGTSSAAVSHILSCCKVALDEGQYTYRHDNVLAEIVTSLQILFFPYTSVSSCSDSGRVCNGSQ